MHQVIEIDKLRVNLEKSRRSMIQKGFWPEVDLQINDENMEAVNTSGFCVKFSVRIEIVKMLRTRE